MNKLTLSLCVAAAGALLTGCSEENSSKIDGIIDVPTTDNITLSRSEEVVNEGLNDFAFDFLNAAADKYDQVFDNAGDGNMAVSPLSASMCLALVANSGDEALTESISKMLGYKDLATLNATCNKLMRFLYNDNGGCEIALANSVWYDNIFSVKPDFVKNINETYYAEVNSAEMSSQATLDIIDKWCAAKTHGRIAKIMDKLPGSQIVLINAMYFNGKWNEPFDKSETKLKDFHGSNGTTIVRMMHSERNGLYYDLPHAEAVAIPFKGNNEMIFMLPKDGTTATELSKSLTAEDWNEKTAHECAIALDVPRFAMETSSTLDDALSSLGLNLSFTGLDKMGIDIAGKFQVVQKTSTSVDEEGAVAAAVTAAGEYTSYVPGVGATLVLDRPFIFFLRNTVTGSILMAGRINNLPNAD